MKKLASLILALTLVLSPGTSAFAAEEPIEIEGEVHYVETDIYEVALPTEAAFKFAIDPQGLFAAEDGDLLADLDPDGKIVSAPAMPFINNSSYAVKLTAELQATKSTGVATDVSPVPTAAAGPTFVQTLAGVVGTANNDILLYAAASSTDMQKADDTFTLVEKAIPIVDSATTTLNFILPAADYELTKSGGTSYSLKFVEDTGHGNALRIGGKIAVGDSATAVNWAEFGDKTKYPTLSTVGLKATFTIAKATTLEVTGFTGDTTNKYMSDYTSTLADNVRIAVTSDDFVDLGDAADTTTYESTGFIVDGATQQNVTISGTHDKSTDLVVPFFLKDDETISKVTWNTGNTDWTSNTAFWSFANNKFTIKSASTMGTTTAGSKYVIVTVGTKQYKVTFTV